MFYYNFFKDAKIKKISFKLKIAKYFIIYKFH